MLKYEWKKLLFNRRGIWLILFLLTAELLGTLLFTQPYDKELEANREVYESYLSQVEGPLTQEKQEALEAEMERLFKAEKEMSQLKMDYYAGKVSEEDYRTGFDELIVDTEKYPGFSKLYTQYIFVREAKNRSFLYTGGWEVLLTDQKPDYLLLLALIILLTPIFCEEYASGMHEILLTQKKSARYAVVTKVAVALTLTAVLTAVVQLFSLIYCALKFGLPHGDFTLQSLRSFGSAEKTLTLWQAFWLQYGLKTVGYLYAATLILAVSVALKKFALTLMACIAILPIPFLTVTDTNSFLRIPGPWALTLGSIYLNGSKKTLNAAGETVFLAEELLMPELSRYLLLVVVIVAVMLLVIWRKNINWHVRCSRRKAALALCAAVLLSGCGAKQEETAICYNSSQSYWCETNDYCIVSDFFESYMAHKKNGKVAAFPADALAGETVFCESAFFSDGQSIYYIKTDTWNPNAGSDSVIQESSLVRLDADTFTETVVYQFNQDATWFFGLLDRVNTEPRATILGSFFVHGSCLYFDDLSGEGLCRMNMTTGDYETVDIDKNSMNLAYDGKNLYYADSYNRLTIHNLDTGEIRHLDDVIVDRFLLTPEGIYFTSRRDSNSLWLWPMEGEAAVKISDISATGLYWDEDYLWLSDKNGVMWRLDHDGANRKVFSMEHMSSYTICIPKRGDTWIAMDMTEKTICVIDKHTLEYTTMEF